MLQDFDEMGSKDGFSNNKLLDDFSYGDLTRPEYLFRRDRNHHRQRFNLPRTFKLQHVTTAATGMPAAEIPSCAGFPRNF